MSIFHKSFWHSIDKDGQVKSKILFECIDKKQREKLVIQSFLRLYKDRENINEEGVYHESEKPDAIYKLDKGKILYFEHTSLSDNDEGHRKQKMKLFIEKELKKRKLENIVIYYSYSSTEKDINESLSEINNFQPINNNSYIFEELLKKKKTKSKVVSRLLKKSKHNLIFTDGIPAPVEKLILSTIKSKENIEYTVDINKIILVIEDRSICYSNSDFEESVKAYRNLRLPFKFKQIFIVRINDLMNDGSFNLSAYPIKT